MTFGSEGRGISSDALFVLSMLALLYRYCPCRRSAKWHWVGVWSLFAMVVTRPGRSQARRFLTRGSPI
jgi:uncharacterized BrkB/YihY/UPF0761 family membrane protein